MTSLSQGSVYVYNFIKFQNIPNCHGAYLNCHPAGNILGLHCCKHNYFTLLLFHKLTYSAISKLICFYDVKFQFFYHEFSTLFKRLNPPYQLRVEIRFLLLFPSSIHVLWALRWFVAYCHGIISYREVSHFLYCHCVALCVNTRSWCWFGRPALCNWLIFS